MSRHHTSRLTTVMHWHRTDTSDSSAPAGSICLFLTSIPSVSAAYTEVRWRSPRVGLPGTAAGPGRSQNSADSAPSSADSAPRVRRPSARVAPAAKVRGDLVSRLRDSGGILRIVLVGPNCFTVSFNQFFFQSGFGQTYRSHVNSKFSTYSASHFCRGKKWIISYRKRMQLRDNRLN